MATSCNFLPTGWPRQHFIYLLSSFFSAGREFLKFLLFSWRPFDKKFVSPQASQEVRREIPAGQGRQTRNSYQCFVLNKLFECVLYFPPDRAAQTRLLRLRLGSVKVQPEVLPRTGNTFSAIWQNSSSRALLLPFAAQKEHCRPISLKLAL